MESCYGLRFDSVSQFLVYLRQSEGCSSNVSIYGRTRMSFCRSMKNAKSGKQLERLQKLCMTPLKWHYQRTDFPWRESWMTVTVYFSMCVLGILTTNSVLCFSLKLCQICRHLSCFSLHHIDLHLIPCRMVVLCTSVREGYSSNVSIYGWIRLSMSFSWPMRNVKCG